jgi:hypothetical protein
MKYSLVRAACGVLAVAGALPAGPALGQTSYPMITHAMPVAVQRGKTSEIAVEGQMSFFGVYKALFEGTGISAEVIADPKADDLPPTKRAQVRSVKLRITVAPDAQPGVREFRLASSLGVSSTGQLLVVEEPVVSESGDNNTPAGANPISPPCVVCGRIEAAEDVDFFRFHAEAGQVLTFEVHCARLQDKIHDLQKHADPMLAVFDAEGRELAANDDTYFADPLLTFSVPKTGDYFVQVRDSKYDGDARWVYALLATPRPYVSHIFPMAGNPGQRLEVEPVGSAHVHHPRLSLQVPSQPGLHTVQANVPDGRTNPIAVIASPLPQLLEQEPNDTPEQATRISIPCGINGRIGARRDLDHFIFSAVKGRAIHFEVHARRFGTLLQSSLDSFLEVMTPTGAVLASNDDLFGKDSGLVFTPPSDGDYILRIRDLHNRGGPAAVYYIEADMARPDYRLRCDPDKAMIGPGSSTAWYVHVVRENGFAGPVRVEARGLPEGVQVSPMTIPANMTQGLLVVTAAPGAARGVANVELIGTALVPGPNGKEEPLVHAITPNQEIYFPGGGRGRFDVKMQTIAVTDPSDILRLDVSQHEITLKPGEEVRIDVTLQRRPDYDKGVSLDVLLRHLGGVFGNPLPPGVTLVEDKSKTLLGTGSRGHIVLRAAPDAPPADDVPISVLAHVSVNFVVKVSYSSPVIRLSIRK